MAFKKNRQINTHFWEDNYISELNPAEKLLFLYLLTNPLTDVSGVYEIQIRRIAFDTKLEESDILKIIKKFSENEKIFYIQGYIYVKNFRKHQKTNPSIEVAIKNSLKELPEEIFNKIKAFEQTDDRLSTDCIEVGLKEKEKLKLKLKEKEKENKFSSFKKGKPFYEGQEMRLVKGKWFVIPKEGGSWLEFAGNPEKDINWR